MSATELKLYDGVQREDVYLAILGQVNLLLTYPSTRQKQPPEQVFDVSKGQQYYGPDSNSEYRYFAGRDASRAFVSGEFHDTDKAPHLVDGMSDDQVRPKSLYWRQQTERWCGADVARAAVQLNGVEFWRKFYHDHDQYKQVS